MTMACLSGKVHGKNASAMPVQSRFLTMPLSSMSPRLCMQAWGGGRGQDTSFELLLGD